MNRFLDEIEEQPQALKETLSFYVQSQGKEKLRRFVDLWKSGKFDKIIITGMGSSFFIAGMAATLFNQQHIPSFAINASELLHYQLSLINETSLFVCISQSGESYEIVAILKELPPNVTVIGITNEANSTLSKKANETLLTMAGKEEMTSTKSYVSSCLATYMLSLAFQGSLNDSSITDITDTIQSVSDLLKNQHQWLSKAVEMVAHTPFIQLIGRGPVFATVQQSALMLMEATRNPASALLGGEFRHGPMEAVKDGFHCIVFAPVGKTYAQSITITSDILKYGGKVLLITDQIPSLTNENLYRIVIPFTNEALFAITSIIPIQLIVNQWSIEDNNEPGNFTRGSKITTIE